MACTIVRQRGVDLAFVDILSDTNYTVSPVLQQRDSEVAQAQQLIKQYFAENVMTDNPQISDIVHFYNQSDQIVKAQQQQQVQQDTHKPVQYNALNPLLDLQVDDYQGILSNKYGSIPSAPLISSIQNQLDKLEEQLAWIIAQTANADEFISRAVCCLMLFSDKLKPTVKMYLDGNSDVPKSELENEASKLTQDIQNVVDVINALDFSQFADITAQPDKYDQLETQYISVMNQQFSQLINKFTQAFMSKYMPIIDKLSMKSMLNENTTMTNLLGKLKEQYNQQLSQLNRSDVYSKMTDFQKSAVQEQLKAEFDTISSMLWSSMQNIRIPDGTALGDVCLPMFKYISSSLPEIVNGFMYSILNLLKQHYYTSPKFDDPSTLKPKQCNYILKQCAQALVEVSKAVQADSANYAKLQRSCFDMTINLQVIKLLLQPSNVSESTSAKIEPSNTARESAYNMYKFNQPVLQSTEKLAQLPWNVSDKLREVMQFLSGILPKGGR